MNTSPARRPACSIVVPCYNAEATLGEAIDSILAQTFQDFEIIAVDDGSRDATAALLDAMAQCEPRLQVIHQVNAGCSTARNRAITAARAPLIALIDADDKWPGNHLATHIARFAADPMLGLSFSGTRFVDADGAPTGEACIAKLDGITAADVLRVIPCLTSAMVIRREVFDKVGLFNSRLHRAEDQEWVFRVALGGWKISGLDTLHVDYRQGRAGLSANHDAMLAGYLGMVESARELAPELVAEHGAAAVAGMMRHLARQALKADSGRATAAHYMRRAVATYPRLLLEQPRTTIATLIAAHIPFADALLRRRQAA